MDEEGRGEGERAERRTKEGWYGARLKGKTLEEEDEEEENKEEEMAL